MKLKYAGSFEGKDYYFDSKFNLFDSKGKKVKKDDISLKLVIDPKHPLEKVF